MVSTRRPGKAAAAGPTVAPDPAAPQHGQCERRGVPRDRTPHEEFVVPDEFMLPPDDLYDFEDPHPPVVLSEEDLYDNLPAMSRVDWLDWLEWAGVDQDEAEREMLRRKAPAWVFLPPGAELAAALERLRPQCESPVALIEAMKAAARMEAWAASIKTSAMASFVRQRKAQATEIPRPTQIDTSGRPIDPERSWSAEIGAALHLSTDTAARHIDTALHLTGPLTATHTALRCGALTWSKALAISEATRHLPTDAAQAVEAHVLRRAPGQTHKNLRESLRRQVAKHTIREDADRHRAAVTDRTCKIVPLPDGMAGLWVVHTADKIQQMWVVIQAMADLAKRGTPNIPSTATSPTGTTSPSSTGSSTTRTAHSTASTGTSAETIAGTAVGTAVEMAAHPSAAEFAGRAVGEPVGEAAGEATGESADDAVGGAAGVPSPNRRDPAPRDPHQRDSAARDPDAGSAGCGSDRRGPDRRTAEQRRADVMADVFEHMLHNGLDWLGRRLPDQHRRRPHIEVLIPATTLLGMDDDPCELTGYGPIPADMARRIATDSTWRRLLTDPTNGTVLEASTTRHDPSTLVTETLLARHPTCAWPGCNRTSRQCDRDHTTPFTQTGRTTLTGLAPYCEYHHVIKDHPDWGWSSTTHPDGSVTLTAPTGHRYITVPPARGPVTPDQATGQPAPHPPNDPPPF
ncbi:HNH endonuclease signature motif containing protein [Kribbella shirazensis]|nr:HNH endonuclease signature motif containing protein [Kribbella shirazensis]